MTKIRNKNKHGRHVYNRSKSLPSDGSPYCGMHNNNNARNNIGTTKNIYCTIIS